MQTQTDLPDRETIQAALAEALKRLPGIDGVFETTGGLMATSASGGEVRITVAVDRPSAHHTVEVVGDSLIVLDQDGNGCECHQLRGLREAKRQLRRWQDKYTFDYAETLRAVSDFFTNR